MRALRAAAWRPLDGLMAVRLASRPSSGASSAPQKSEAPRMAKKSVRKKSVTKTSRKSASRTVRKSRYPREWSWPGGAKIAVTLNMALESFVRASQVTLEKTSNKVDHFSLTYADYAFK